MKEIHREIAEDLFSRISMAMTQIGRAVPVYIMILGNNDVFPIIIEQQIDLQEYANIAISVANEYNAEAMILICEQFMVSKQKGDAELQDMLDGKLRASQHPDRKEFLTLMYMDRTGKCESMIAEIHKDLSGTPFTRDFKWIDEAVTSMITPWWTHDSFM